MQFQLYVPMFIKTEPIYHPVFWLSRSQATIMPLSACLLVANESANDVSEGIIAFRHTLFIIES
jgi:hypothetical protein